MIFLYIVILFILLSHRWEVAEAFIEIKISTIYLYISGLNSFRKIYNEERTYRMIYKFILFLMLFEWFFSHN